jgi:hypothetical protein
MRLSMFAVLGVAIMTAGGCSQSPPPIVPVEGRVMLNGKPLAKAEVRFNPALDYVDGSYTASGETDEEGRFKLTCRGQEGACACDHNVTVGEAPLPGEMRGMSAAAQAKASAYLNSLKNRPIPQQYATLAQSPLKITVTADKKEYLIELTR